MHPNPILADVSSALGLFQALFAAAISITLWRMTAWQRRYEGLERRLHDATSHAVDERLRGLAVQLESQTQAASTQYQELRQRLVATDAAIAAMGERNLQTELSLATRIDLLKDHIRDVSICKTDLDRYEAAVDRRLTRIESRLQEIAI